MACLAIAQKMKTYHWKGAKSRAKQLGKESKITIHYSVLKPCRKIAKTAENMSKRRSSTGRKQQAAKI